jgi:hypothetical protein
VGVWEQRAEEEEKRLECMVSKGSYTPDRVDPPQGWLCRGESPADLDLGLDNLCSSGASFSNYVYGYDYYSIHLVV